MALFSKKEKQAIRIDKQYDGHKRHPDFIVGSPSKIAKTINDAMRNTNHFAEMMAHEDTLPESPQLIIAKGSFGYADSDMEIPIVARFSYTFDTNVKKIARSRGRKFSLNGLAYLLAFLIAAVMIGSAFVSESLSSNAQALAEIATDCTVFTKDGKATYVTIFGERFYMNSDGSPPAISREVTPFEKERLEHPLVHCKWRSDDGIMPPDMWRK